MRVNLVKLNRYHWYCANCTATVEADPHARCAVCGSDALTRAGRRVSQPAEEGANLTFAEFVGGLNRELR